MRRSCAPCRCRAAGTGYEIRNSSSYDWNGRRRGETPFTVLQHTIAGGGNLLFERRPYRLKPGDTMLTIVPHNHRYWLEDGGRWEFFWISMSGQEAVRIHRIIQATTGPVFRLRPETIEHLANCCLRLVEGEGETPGVASAIAYEAAMALYDEVFSRHGVRTEGAGGVLQQVIEHFRENVDKRLTVNELAEVAGFSRAHFSRMFSASEGIAPAEFVLHERMRRWVIAGRQDSVGEDVVAGLRSLPSARGSPSQSDRDSGGVPLQSADGFKLSAKNSR